MKHSTPTKAEWPDGSAQIWEYFPIGRAYETLDLIYMNLYIWKYSLEPGVGFKSC